MLPRDPLRFEAAMKEQYVGDINDYRKYALLRMLSAKGVVGIGVCWMLTPPDGRTDGQRIDYLRHPERWRIYDPSLFDELATLVGEPDGRRLHMIEGRRLIPEAVYFNEIVPDDRAGRDDYIKSAMAALADVDLIFFDPDNGLEIASKPRGRRGSSKFIFRDEIASAYATGKSLLLYQHYPRRKREQFIRATASDLCKIAPTEVIWAFRTSDVVFLLLIHPKHDSTLSRAAKMAASKWDGRFITGEPITVDSY